MMLSVSILKPCLPRLSCCEVKQLVLLLLMGSHGLFDDFFFLLCNKATVPNYKDFAGWVGRTKQRPVCAMCRDWPWWLKPVCAANRYTVHTTYRPTPLSSAPSAGTGATEARLLDPARLKLPGHFLSFRGHTLPLMDDAGSGPSDLRHIEVLRVQLFALCLLNRILHPLFLFGLYKGLQAHSFF